MFRNCFLSLLLLITIFLLGFVPLSAQGNGEITDSHLVGEEIHGEKLRFQDLLKLQKASSESGEVETRKEDADSSKEKRFCFSFGGGSSQKKYERGGPKQRKGLSHCPLTFRLLEYNIAFMISVDYGSEFGSLTYNTLYMIPLSKSKRTNICIGGGIGNISVDEEGQDGLDYSKKEYTMYNFEVGCKTSLWYLGPYAKVRHSFIKGTKTWRLLILGLDIDIYL